MCSAQISAGRLFSHAGSNFSHFDSFTLPQNQIQLELSKTHRGSSLMHLKKLSQAVLHIYKFLGIFPFFFVYFYWAHHQKQKLKTIVCKKVGLIQHKPPQKRKNINRLGHLLWKAPCIVVDTLNVKWNWSYSKRKQVTPPFSAFSAKFEHNGYKISNIFYCPITWILAIFC